MSEEPKSKREEKQLRVLQERTNVATPVDRVYINDRGGVLHPGQNSALKELKRGGYCSKTAAEIRAKMIRELEPIVDRQIRIAVSGESDADSTRAARTILEYSVGKPKRVELNHEAFASAVVVAVSEVLADYPELLKRVKEAVATEIKRLAPAKDDKIVS